jgi:penicillin-binding protein 1B
MHKNGWLSDSGLQGVLVSPIHTAGFEEYGREAPFFMDYLEGQLQKLYKPEALSSLGLSIYTTLDTRVQAAAENAVQNGLKRLERLYPAVRRQDSEQQLQAAAIVMQPRTGAILAMVGGRDYSVSQFNRMTHARRQPGSTFKPFVYLSALDRFTPISRLSNMPRTIEKNGTIWRPKNFEPDAPPVVTLRSALAHSYNLATIDLALKVGLEKILDTTSSFHFSTPLKPYPSIALGALEMIPLEVARAYCVFAADGIQPYPLSLKSVLDENGQVIERRHMNIERITSPSKAFIITSLLQSVVKEGTARNLKKMGVKGPVAGKTGTTNDNRDAWFVGYTPDILALIWVGFDHGDSIGMTGSAAAMPIWADLMTHIPQYLSQTDFRMPPGVVRCSVCLQSGCLANENRCPEIVEEYFLKQNAPSRPCPLHGKKTARIAPSKTPSLFNDRVSRSIKSWLRLPHF